MPSTAAQQSADFIRTLFLPTDLVELRAIGESGVAQNWVLASELIEQRPGVVGWIERQQAEHRNIYVGINPRLRPGGSAKDVGPARCLFVDFDDCSLEYAKAQVAGSSLPEPTTWAESGHGAHGYWRMTEALTDHEKWSGLQKRLIAMLGSDDKIHDPPRIMRLPGTTNFKRDPVVECRLAGGTGQPVTLENMGITPVEDSYLAVRSGPLPEFNQANLSRKTLEFLNFGAGDGERNARLFKAAADLMGNGADMDAAMAMLVPAARKCGLEDWEIEGTVRSAYKKARSPAKPAPLTTEGLAINRPWSGENQTVVVVGDSAVKMAADGKIEEVAKAKERAAFRGVVSNVVDSHFVAEGKDGKPVKKPIAYYKPIDQISVEMREMTGNWPRVSGKLLFYAEDPRDGEIPTMESIRSFGKPDKLFAWLQEKGDLRWSEAVCFTPSNKEARTPCNKAEFFQHLTESRLTPSYAGVAILPHHPPMRGVYYVPLSLPQSEGTALKELLDALNPETEQDRQLLLAALLTPGWGGPPGARPSFVIYSSHGRGVGKSLTAQLICDVWGGPFEIDHDEDSTRIKERLLGDSGLSTRCVLFDNKKGKLNRPDIEAMITAKVIDGRRLYHGRFTRVNYLTWFFTANHPKVSEDIAVRAVPIKIGRQRHGVSFADWANEWLPKNRAALLADLLARLQSPPRGSISSENRDRWQAWQDAVLCRVDDPDGLARLVKERRHEVNDDREMAEAAACAVRGWTRMSSQPGPVYRISKDEMVQLLTKAGVIDDGMTRKGVSTWLMTLRTEDGPLCPLMDAASNGERFWKWDSFKDPIQQDPDIPV